MINTKMMISAPKGTCRLARRVIGLRRTDLGVDREYELDKAQHDRGAVGKIIELS